MGINSTNESEGRDNPIWYTDTSSSQSVFGSVGVGGPSGSPLPPPLPPNSFTGYRKQRFPSVSSNSSATSSLSYPRSFALPKIVQFMIFVLFFTVVMGIILAAIFTER